MEFDKKWLVEIVNRVLDECEYNGKTIREWADLIANPKTKADRIRTMTDEALADFLYATWKEQDEFSKNVCNRCPDTSCQPKCWLDWLREEDET